jgi:hypothetical protein
LVTPIDDESRQKVYGLCDTTLLAPKKSECGKPFVDNTIQHDLSIDFLGFGAGEPANEKISGNFSTSADCASTSDTLYEACLAIESQFNALRVVTQRCEQQSVCVVCAAPLQPPYDTTRWRSLGDVRVFSNGSSARQDVFTLPQTPHNVGQFLLRCKSGALACNRNGWRRSHFGCGQRQLLVGIVRNTAATVGNVDDDTSYDRWLVAPPEAIERRPCPNYVLEGYHSHSDYIIIETRDNTKRLSSGGDVQLAVALLEVFDANCTKDNPDDVATLEVFVRSNEVPLPLDTTRTELTSILSMTTTTATSSSSTKESTTTTSSSSPTFNISSSTSSTTLFNTNVTLPLVTYFVGRKDSIL